MASGDFIDVEVGDALAILKHETNLMADIFELSVKHDADFLEDPEDPTPDRINQTEKVLKRNKEVVAIDKKNDKQKKVGHRRVNTEGEVSYKKIDTSKIMSSVQLGIQNCVGGLAAKPERDLLMGDFMTVESTSFTTVAMQSNRTSEHGRYRGSEFIFKTYAPVAFRHFRDLFGIKSESFVSSFCEQGLVELPNPGASGSVFYLTQNDEFITKTVQHKEALFLQKLLPGYYLNLNQNPCTLLPKFFGLYCYKCDTKNVRMLVMNNVLPSSIKIHQKYDLKGSTHKRKSSVTECQKCSPTFKDLDFIEHHPEGIFLDVGVYDDLVQTIQRDCRVLESFQIIDYSLLVGVHNVDQAKREKNILSNVPNEDQFAKEETINSPSGDGNVCDTTKTSDVREIEGADISVNRTGFMQTLSKSENCKFERTRILKGLPARQANGEQVLLFIGIIDILQSYRLKKRLEHVWKSIIHDGDSVSVHNPGFYSKRFQEFMSNRVFKTMPNCQKNTRRKTALKFVR